MIVLDASAAFALIANAPPIAERVRERLTRPGESIHVPHLFDVEILNVMRRYVLRGQMAPDRASRAITALGSLGLIRHPHVGLLDRIWQPRENLSAYDAAYVSLAESLEAPLITLDDRLSSAPGHRARIELLGRTL